MTLFTDAAGRTWPLTIHDAAIERVRAMTGHDLIQLDAGEPPLLMRLITDPLTASAVIAAVLRPWLEHSGIDADDFENGFNADARDALLDELVGYFVRTQRPHHVELVQNIRATVARHVEASARRLKVDSRAPRH